MATALLFPTAQDHKRALDGDQGLNTGGRDSCTGSIPHGCRACRRRPPDPRAVAGRLCRRRHRLPWTPVSRRDAHRERTASSSSMRGSGHPETQVYLTDSRAISPNSSSRRHKGCLQPPQPKMEAGIVGLRRAGLRWLPRLVPEGIPIMALPRPGTLPGVKVFHAGTAIRDGKIVTAGGRVLGVTALGPTLLEARDRAYAAARTICFEGIQYRICR